MSYKFNKRNVILLTLSQMTIFRLPNSQSLQRTILNLIKDGRNFFKWVENTVGEGEIALHKQFLLLPQCFQKTYMSVT